MSAVTPMPGGGEDYVYDIDQTEANFFVPPTGFQPADATAGQLAEYGFPPRPSDGPALSSWLTVMGAYKTTPTPDISVVGATPDQADTQVSPATTVTTNPYWAGWVANASSQRYVASQMSYVQRVGEPTTCNDSSLAAWTGLGGWGGSTNLVQDGTEAPTSATNLCSGTASGICAWYEYLNSTTNVGPKILSKVVINGNDSMYLYVAYSTSLGEINFYVADNTTGTDQPLLITGVGSDYYDGSSADFIGAEGYRTSQYSPPITKFGTYTISSAEGETTSGTWENVGSAPNPIQIYMGSNVTGHELVNPGLLSGGNSFPVTWDNCS